MIIFGGFNGEYYNDLYYINVFELKSRLQIPTSPRSRNIARMVNNKELSDCSIQTYDEEEFYLHKGLLKTSFKDQESVDAFLEKADKQFDKD